MTFDDHIFTLCNEACMQLNAIDRLKHYLGKNKWVLLNRVPTSTQLHSPPPSSTHLHPAYFSLHPALCNTLNNIWTKILHVIGAISQNLGQKIKSCSFWLKLDTHCILHIVICPKSTFGQIWTQEFKVDRFVWKLVLLVSQGYWFRIQT